MSDSHAHTTSEAATETVNPAFTKLHEEVENLVDLRMQVREGAMLPPAAEYRINQVLRTIHDQLRLLGEPEEKRLSAMQKIRMLFKRKKTSPRIADVIAYQTNSIANDAIDFRTVMGSHGVPVTTDQLMARCSIGVDNLLAGVMNEIGPGKRKAHRPMLKGKHHHSVPYMTSSLKPYVSAAEAGNDLAGKALTRLFKARPGSTADAGQGGH